MCISAGLAQTQKEEPERSAVFDQDAAQLEKSTEQIIPQQQFLEQVYEKAIDPNEYILGPGDQILIKIWGVLDQQFVAPVTPEGFLIVPTVAEVRVSGLSLAEATVRIVDSLNKVFRNSEFSVRLVKMRKFRVFVVGDIENPGSYYVRGTDRLSDVIQLAGGLGDWGDDTRLQIRHISGTVDTVNISEFYLNGTLEQNPLLQGGDMVFVPPIDLQAAYVVVEGNVGSQGVYQLRHNESLFQLLNRLRSINRRSDIENLVLVRGNQRHVFDLLSDEDDAQSEILQAGDRIIVPTNRTQVYVRGEVAQPGPYDYLANYTAQDYAGAAGLLETAKGLDALYVIRYRTGKIEKGENIVVQNGDIVVVPRKARESLKDVLSILTPIISIGLSAFALIRASK